MTKDTTIGGEYLEPLEAPLIGGRTASRDDVPLLTTYIDGVLCYWDGTRWTEMGR